MGDRRLKRTFAAAAVLAGLSCVPMPNATADARATTTNDAAVQVTTFRSTYYPGDDELVAPTLVVPKGAGLTLTNLDAFAAHGLSSDAVLPDGERLFTSGVLNFRGSAPVTGVETLPAGTYPFHCAVHEDNMHGTLVVQ